MDEEYLEKFRNSIEFDGEKYLVDLPFKPSMDKVESNWEVCLAIMNRVHDDLKRRNLLDEYTSLIKDQLKRNVLEEISVDPENYHKYVFIPHRAVIKDSSQTTRVRIVLNCSFAKRYGNSGSSKPVSLNSAIFEGRNLLSDLLSLVLQFRTNKYVLIGDVERAYHSICIKSPEQKAKFCLFWKIDGKICVFQHAGLLMGLSISQYAMIEVIKHH